MTESTTCYICDHDNEDVLQRHHVVPLRYGGPDTADNTVLVCPTCHTALERIYDNRFWETVARILAAESLATITELEAELENQRSSSRTSIVDQARIEEALTEAEDAKKRLKEV